MSNLSFSDVFISGNKTLTLNKRPNLTIVQKQNKAVPPDSEEPNLTINRLVLSPNSHSGVDFGNITESYDALELGGVMTSAGVQTNDNQNFLVEQNSSSNMSGFASQDEGKKGKKKTNTKKKGKKEENKVDLWDLMKSAGIGDDEFDEPTDTFQQENVKVAEGLEISSADTELLAQLQSATQLPNNIRVIVGEDGRPVFFNGSNVLVPDAVHTGAATCAAEPSEADSVFQNMILPDNVFNFTPQALATAQTQLNQLIQDHGGLTTSSADQQLLSQIFGSSSSNISGNSGNIVANSSSSNSVMQPTGTALLTSAQSHPTMTSSGNDPMMVNVTSSSTEVTQTNLVQKPEMKSEFIGGPPPGLPPLGPDSLVITNNNGVPTLVASPALMQYLQTHQGIIQFQHDPVTKTIQPSLIIPHPQAKIEVATATQDVRNDKIPAVVTTTRNITQPKEIIVTKPRTEQKSSVGTTTEDPKTISNVYSVITNQVVPGVVKLNPVKFVKDNPPFLQIATETNNLINFKESNKGLSEKDIIEIDRKILHNRTLLNQCIAMGNSRTGQSVPAVPNVIIKDGVSNEAVFYQLSGVSVSGSGVHADNKTTETQTLDDLQHLDMGTIKGVQTTTSVNSPNTNSDFQTKFLESIGMANKVTKASVGTGTTPSPNPPVTVQTSPAKRGRKKKTEKIQNQATQVDGKMEMTFNIAQLTPEQNLKLNQALQSRGVTSSQVHNFDTIKQIIQEEIRKITAGTLQNTSIRFVSAPSLQQPEDTTDSSDNISTSGVLYNNPNLNQLLDQPTGQGNIISLQGNDVVAINNGNQRIFASQNQLLSSGHLVTSNNQILAIGGNHNQLVSLGNPINSSNQIVTLGNPPNVMSVNGNNVTTPVIVGSNGNVVAIVHQTPVSGQGSGIVQRLQTIQLTAPKQQVSQPVTTQAGRFQTQATQQSQQIQTQPSQTIALQQQNQVQQMYITTNANANNAQPCKTSFTTQTAVSCGTSTSDINSTPHPNAPKLTVPPTLMISDVPTSTYGPLYVSPNTSGKNVTKCEKGTSPIQIQMGTQTVSNIEYRSGKMSTGTMTSPNTGKPQAVVAPAIVIQQTEAQSPTWQMKPRTQQQQQQTQQQSQQQQQQQQQPSMSPLRNQVTTLNRTAFIEQQMRTDQAGATMPDTRTPFLSKSDACKRLIRYHVMDEKALSPQDLAAADDMFEATAQHLLDKFRVMKEKYKYLLMLESMREVSTAERIMVDRNFIIEERIELEELREKEKRLQEEFENPTICYSSTGEATIMKTDITCDDSKIKKEEPFCPEDIKFEKSDDESDLKGKSLGDVRSDSAKESPFRMMETNRNFEPKSETKECKIIKPPRPKSRSPTPENEEFDYNISGKCKIKTNRTFSDGSSKSSLDSSKDEDSGTDINAQVQSAIDSILNLQKCEDNSPDDGSVTKKKKRRRGEERGADGSKRVRTKDYDGKGNSSDDSDYEDGCGSNADHLLDEAIRSIMTS
ncbi:UNVERIFIED_CONTAM: hypothetical protein PYX00_004690 [Menopon gallinae]|uniref:GLTSCR protein conserved domain-containing protein n=1 Tax=Menopon gallinae TaxID=328185 RepID=A0AAW2I7E1_9NEOP